MSSLPVLASQMRAVLSSEAVTIRVPSGLKAAELTSALCPVRLVRIAPGASVPNASGTVCRGGDDAGPIWVERGKDRVGAMLKARQERPCARIPDTDGCISGGGDDARLNEMLAPYPTNRLHN